MDVDIVTIGVQTAIKYQRSVHERARVDERPMFSHTHLLNIKHIAAIEDLEKNGWFSAEYHDLFISYLVR